MSSGFSQRHTQRLPIQQAKPDELVLLGVSCRTSVVILPDGIYDWPDASAIEEAATLLAFLAGKKAVLGDFFLLGSGARHILPSRAFRESIDALGLGLEVMDNAAASRTYNILYAENRMFAAGFMLG